MESKFHNLTPAGALLIVISFFLPWINVRCAGKKVGVSGQQFAEGDPILWLVPVGAIITLIIFFSYKDKLHKAKIAIVVPTIVGGIILGIKIAEFVDKYEKQIDSMEPNVGIFGIGLGYILVVTGVVNIIKPPEIIYKPIIKQPLEKIKCPSCGELNPEGSKFCTSCSKSLIQGPLILSSLICPSCSAENEPNNKFCINCGVLIK